MDNLLLTFVEWISPTDGYAWCYCSETWSLNLKTTYDPAIARETCFLHVRWELAERLNCQNLKKRGWLFVRGELIPPKITFEQAIVERRKHAADWHLNYPPDFDGYTCFKNEIIVPLPGTKIIL